MAFQKQGYEWTQIITHNQKWFSRETMKFFGCKVYWNSLTKVNNYWFFITSEDNFDATQTLYSIRSVTPDYEIGTVSWQQHETLAECRQDLKRRKKWIEN